MKTTELLAERGKTHGDFCKHACAAQVLKNVIRCHMGEKWSRLDWDQMEALDMIAHKIGRIVAGDPNHVDHWADIAGYAELVAKNLRTKETERAP